MKKTMKNIWKSLFVAALFVSCSEQMTEETVAPEVNNGKAIKFEVVNEGGRAAFFQGEGHGVAFEEGDKIGIRHYTGDEGCAAVHSTANAIEDETEKTAYLDENVKRGNYTLTGDVWVKTDYMDISYVDDKVNNICAYYPATNNRYAHNISAVTLPAAQVQTAANDHSHIDDYMIMMAEPQRFDVGVQPETVGLYMQNLLSIVEVTLTGSEAVEVASLMLSTNSDDPLAFSEGTMNVETTLKNGEFPISVTTGSSSVTLTLDTPATLTQEGAKFYFVVLPGEHQNKDINLKVTTSDGQQYSVAMGAITFKMNKVYRPSIDFNKFEDISPAEIEHTFDNGTSSVVYGTPTLFEENGLIITNRAHFRYYNIPERVKGLQVAAMHPSTYPTTNKIKATTAGWVYLLIGLSSITQVEPTHAFFTEKGWEAFSAIPTVIKPEEPGAELLYYNTGTENNAMMVYGKKFAVGEDFDLTTYPNTNFQGIRPIAKKITNKHDKFLMLAFNFSLPLINQDADEWPIRTSYSEVVSGAYVGSKTYQFLNGISYALEFSATEGVSGIAMNHEGFLMMHVRNNSTGGEWIGLPAIEGYKLITVEGNTFKKGSNTPYCVIVSGKDADGNPIEVSNSKNLANNNYNTSWKHTLESPQSATRYYLLAKDDDDAKNEDVLMTGLYLTYEKVE